MRKLPLLLLLIISVSNLLCAQEPTLEQKAAQMLMVGFRGTTANAQSDIANWLKNYRLGGVILFDYDAPTKKYQRNITSANQLKQLTDDLKKLSSVPLFIAVDEEGGKVSRLKKNYGFEPTVTQKYLGTLDNEDSTRFYARRIAKACRQAGININFAPTVDVNVNPNCPVIGKKERSYSADADVVARNAKWFVSEHQQQGVLCAIKHFPGHGSSVSDTHLGMADVTKTWTDNELKPYKSLLTGNQKIAVMTAHIFNRNIDPKYPATLSSSILGKLRKQMNFNGLIFSDDMMMSAISKYYTLEESVCLAINAGVDVLVFSNNIDAYNADIVRDVVAVIVKLVKDGKVSEQRISESYNRIIKAKQGM